MKQNFYADKEEIRSVLSRQQLFQRLLHIIRTRWLLFIGQGLDEIEGTSTAYLWLSEEIREYNRQRSHSEFADIIGCWTHIRRLQEDSWKQAFEEHLTHNTGLPYHKGVEDQHLIEWQSRQIKRHRRVLSLQSLKETECSIIESAKRLHINGLHSILRVEDQSTE